MKVWDLKTQYRYAHIKRDGWQIAAIVGTNGVQTITKNGNEVDISFLNDIALLARHATPGHIVYAELWKPELPASSIKTQIIAQDTELQFEVIAVNGMHNALPLDVVAAEVENWGLNFIPFYDRRQSDASLGSFTDVRQLWDDVYDGRDASALVEGFVLKDGNRTEHVKWKPVKSVDLKVVSIVPGTPGSKYDGLIGSLTCALRDGTVVCNAGTGLKDHHRQLDPADVIGQIVEVSYDCIAGQGKLRFPRFVRFRNDLKLASVTLPERAR